MTAKEKRPVGRPPMDGVGTRHVTITVPANLVPVLRELGGSRWVRDQLKAAAAKTTCGHPDKVK